jgi:hypothetical protein
VTFPFQLSWLIFMLFSAKNRVISFILCSFMVAFPIISNHPLNLLDSCLKDREECFFVDSIQNFSDRGFQSVRVSHLKSSSFHLIYSKRKKSLRAKFGLCGGWGNVWALVAHDNLKTAPNCEDVHRSSGSEFRSRFCCGHGK